MNSWVMTWPLVMKRLIACSFIVLMIIGCCEHEYSRIRLEGRRTRNDRCHNDDLNDLYVDTTVMDLQGLDAKGFLDIKGLVLIDGHCLADSDTLLMIGNQKEIDSILNKSYYPDKLLEDPDSLRKLIHGFMQAPLGARGYLNDASALLIDESGKIYRIKIHEDETSIYGDFFTSHQLKKDLKEMGILDATVNDLKGLSIKGILIIDGSCLAEYDTLIMIGNQREIEGILKKSFKPDKLIEDPDSLKRLIRGFIHAPQGWRGCIDAASALFIEESGKIFRIKISTDETGIYGDHFTSLQLKKDFEELGIL
ncbi:MAG: hypothetical protein JW860_13325 [Sedimentisphaerales bacterium]|nr:hypothetical protein [Sedimentisphaerales bacterium]